MHIRLENNDHLVEASTKTDRVENFTFIFQKSRKTATLSRNTVSQPSSPTHS